MNELFRVTPITLCEWRYLVLMLLIKGNKIHRIDSINIILFECKEVGKGVEAKR